MTQNGTCPTDAPGAGATLTLEELAGAEFGGVSPLGVLGWPIRHSVSPQMHNAALAVLAERDEGLRNFRYHRIEVRPEQLGEALALLHAKGFLGLNLTLPHKVLVLDHVASVDTFAADAGAVNTLVRRGDGWAGFNTDAHGFEQAALAAPVCTFLADCPVVLLGAGGASRAIALKCLDTGCAGLWIGNRSVERLGELVERLKNLRPEAPVQTFDLAAPAGLPKGALVVNATSLGLKADDPSPIDLALLQSPRGIVDTTYGRHRSALLAQADALGIPATNGLPMLVHQGAQALAIWLSQRNTALSKEAVCAMFTAAREALGIHD